MNDDWVDKIRLSKKIQLWHVGFIDFHIFPTTAVEINGIACMVVYGMRMCIFLMRVWAIVSAVLSHNFDVVMEFEISVTT